jgi:hypothetical protein
MVGAEFGAADLANSTGLLAADCLRLVYRSRSRHHSARLLPNWRSSFALPRAPRRPAWAVTAEVVAQHRAWMAIAGRVSHPLRPEPLALPRAYLPARRSESRIHVVPDVVPPLR